MGGVVNYLPKRPTRDSRYWGQVTVGSRDLFRAEFDASGQFEPGNELNQGYRVSGSWQSNSDYGDGTYQTSMHGSSHPVFTFELPNRTTTLTLDLEFGSAHEKGIGFNTVIGSFTRRPNRPSKGNRSLPERARPMRRISGLGNGRGLTPGGKLRGSTASLICSRKSAPAPGCARVSRYSPERTQRADCPRSEPLHHRQYPVGTWCGYREPVTKAEQDYIAALKEINPGGKRKFYDPQLDPDHFAIVRRAWPPYFWYGDIFNAGKLKGYQPTGTNNTEIGANNTFDYVLLRYGWGGQEDTFETWQSRIELVHEFELAGARNTLLLGFQSLDEESSGVALGHSNATEEIWKSHGHYNLASVVNPTKLLRFAVQGDGVTPSVPYGEDVKSQVSTAERGAYALLQSRFWEDRLNLILGVRWSRMSRDATDIWITDTGLDPGRHGRRDHRYAERNGQPTVWFDLESITILECVWCLLDRGGAVRLGLLRGQYPSRTDEG